MHDHILQFQKYIINKDIVIGNAKLNNILQSFHFFYITQEKELNQNKKIYNNARKSKLIFINKIKDSKESLDDSYFIVVFMKTIIIIQQSLIYLLFQFFVENSTISICFLSNVKYSFEQKIDIKYKKIICDDIFNEEIFNLNQHFEINKPLKFSIIRIWNCIRSCISGYLIKESYQKKKLHWINYLNNQNHTNIFDEKDFIILRMLGYGSVFQVHLAYHIQMEKIFVIKKIKTNINDSEASKLIKREIINYTNLNHPLIPKYIGTLNKQNGIVIEFVNGPTLDNIKKIKLEYDEILSIVYELMQ